MSYEKKLNGDRTSQDSVRISYRRILLSLVRPTTQRITFVKASNFWDVT